MFLYPCFFLSIKLRLIGMSTNLEYRESERKRKKVGRQTSEANEKNGLSERGKTKGDIFCWRNKMKFCSGGMLAATRVKMSVSGSFT